MKCDHEGAVLREYGVIVKSMTIECGERVGLDFDSDSTGKIEFHCFKCNLKRTYYLYTKSCPNWVRSVFGMDVQ